MNPTTRKRAAVLTLLTVTLSGCAISQFHRNQRFYRNYRPPVEINGYEFGSSVTVQPEQIQLITGEGFEGWVVKEWREFDINLVAYFNPDDVSPFAAPARVSNITYFYCSFDDTPGVCGGAIDYESEEVGESQGLLAKIRRTNHERIIAELIAKHGSPQYTDKYSQTIIEGEEETYRSPVNRTQRRVWCDFGKGVPKQCTRSIVAVFSAYLGHGTITYIDNRMYKYLQRYETELKHEHPFMEVITGVVKKLSAEEIAWWKLSPTQFFPKGRIDPEKLHTEIQLEARAKASGKPRPQIKRTMARSEVAQAWLRSYIGSRSQFTTSLQGDYWFGYMEGIDARDFAHRFHLTDEAHKKWMAGAQGSNVDLAYVGRGYTHALAGMHNPPKVSDPCQDEDLNLWQKLKCALKGR